VGVLEWRVEVKWELEFVMESIIKLMLALEGLRVVRVRVVLRTSTASSYDLTVAPSITLEKSRTLIDKPDRP
jgi:hypothetical protein